MHKEAKNTKRSTKVAKELFHECMYLYLTGKKIQELEDKKQSVKGLKSFYAEAQKEDGLSYKRCVCHYFLYNNVHNKTILLLDLVFVTSRLIKVSQLALSASACRLQLVTLPSTLIIQKIKKDKIHFVFYFVFFFFLFFTFCNRCDIK